MQTKLDEEESPIFIFIQSCKKKGIQNCAYRSIKELNNDTKKETLNSIPNFRLKELKNHVYKNPFFIKNLTCLKHDENKCIYVKEGFN